MLLSQIALICWMYSYSKMVYSKRTKMFTLIVAVGSLIYDAFFIYLVIFDPDYLVNQAYDVSDIFNVVALVITIITGISFTLRSIDAEDKKIHYKGIFLLLAFILFTITSFIDAMFLHLPIPLLLMIRIFHILSAVSYYLGFFLPDQLASLFIKEK